MSGTEWTAIARVANALPELTGTYQLRRAAVNQAMLAYRGSAFNPQPLRNWANSISDAATRIRQALPSMMSDGADALHTWLTHTNDVDPLYISQFQRDLGLITYYFAELESRPHSFIEGSFDDTNFVQARGFPNASHPPSQQMVDAFQRLLIQLTPGIRVNHNNMPRDEDRRTSAQKKAARQLRSKAASVAGKASAAKRAKEKAEKELADAQALVVEDTNELRRRSAAREDIERATPAFVQAANTGAGLAGSYSILEHHKQDVATFRRKERDAASRLNQSSAALHTAKTKYVHHSQELEAAQQEHERLQGLAANAVNQAIHNLNTSTAVAQSVQQHRDLLADRVDANSTLPPHPLDAQDDVDRLNHFDYCTRRQVLRLADRQRDVDTAMSTQRLVDYPPPVAEMPDASGRSGGKGGSAEAMAVYMRGRGGGGKYDPDAPPHQRVSDSVTATHTRGRGSGGKYDPDAQTYQSWRHPRVAVTEDDRGHPLFNRRSNQSQLFSSSDDDDPSPDVLVSASPLPSAPVPRTRHVSFVPESVETVSSASAPRPESIRTASSRSASSRITREYVDSSSADETD